MSRWARKGQHGPYTEPARLVEQPTIVGAPEPVADRSFSERVERSGKLWRCVIVQLDADGTRFEKATEWKERHRFSLDYAALHRRQLNWLLDDRPIGGVTGR